MSNPVQFCTRCSNARWVCEAHPQRPWGDVQGACCCGAPGEPCPVCNRVEADEVPKMPEGFRVDMDEKGWRR
jgi:hypothetical protein